MNEVMYCIYCKNEIGDQEDFIKYKGKFYHKECYDLMKEELDEE